MFNDTPQARALMAYLVTADAQKIWVERGGALSANKSVTELPGRRSPSDRPSILANAGVFRFDASDLMPTAMNDAFWKAILDYVKTPASSTRSCPTSTPSRPAPTAADRHDHRTEPGPSRLRPVTRAEGVVHG